MRTVISSAETVPEASLKMLVPSRSLYEIPSNDSCTVSDESCTRLTTLRMPCTSCRVASVREVTPVKALTTRLRSRVVRCQRSSRTTIAFDVAHITRRESTSTAEPARPIQSRPEGEPSDQLSRALMLRKQTSSARAKHRVAHARSAANVSVHKHSTSSRASWYGPQSGAVARAGKKSDITSSSRRALCCTELLLSGASGTVCGIRLCLADSSRLGSSSIFLFRCECLPPSDSPAAVSFSLRLAARVVGGGARTPREFPRDAFATSSHVARSTICTSSNVRVPPDPRLSRTPVTTVPVLEPTAVSPQPRP